MVLILESSFLTTSVFNDFATEQGEIVELAPPDDLRATHLTTVELWYQLWLHCSEGPSQVLRIFMYLYSASKSDTSQVTTVNHRAYREVNQQFSGWPSWILLCQGQRWWSISEHVGIRWRLVRCGSAWWKIRSNHWHRRSMTQLSRCILASCEVEQMWGGWPCT